MWGPPEGVEVVKLHHMPKGGVMMDLPMMTIVFRLLMVFGLLIYLVYLAKKDIFVSSTKLKKVEKISNKKVRKKPSKCLTKGTKHDNICNRWARI